MAFSREFLRAMGLTEEQVKAIIEEHVSVTDALKAQRNQFEQDAKNYKLEADKVPELEKKVKNYEGAEDFKSKYENEHNAFEAYKAQIAKDAETAKVKAAYRKLLIDESINEKRVDAVMKLTDFSEIKLDDKGQLENLEELKKNIGEEWGEYKVIHRERKQQVATPPKDDNLSHGLSRAAELNRKFQQERYGVKTDTGKE